MVHHCYCISLPAFARVTGTFLYSLFPCPLPDTKTPGRWLIRPRVLHGNTVGHVLAKVLTAVIWALDPEFMGKVQGRNKDFF